MELKTQFDAMLVAGNVKTAMKEANASSRDLWSVDISAIRILPDFNVRIHDREWETHIRALANSMKVEGYYQDKPMAGYVAKDGDAQVIYITDGHCRYNAVLLANSEGAEILRVPVVIGAQSTSIEDLTVALFKSNSGKPLTPYEIGIVCKRLTNYGWSVEDISKRLDITELYVDNLLRLVGSPKPIRDMVTSGQVSAALAIHVLRKKGSKALETLQAALDKANGAGKQKVTGKHMPGHGFDKAIKSAAPRLYETIGIIKGDPGYMQLSEGVRGALDELIASIEAKKEAASGVSQ